MNTEDLPMINSAEDILLDILTLMNTVRRLDDQVYSTLCKINTHRGPVAALNVMRAEHLDAFDCVLELRDTLREAKSATLPDRSLFDLKADPLRSHNNSAEAQIEDFTAGLQLAHAAGLLTADQLTELTEKLHTQGQHNTTKKHLYRTESLMCEIARTDPKALGLMLRFHIEAPTSCGGDAESNIIVLTRDMGIDIAALGWPEKILNPGYGSGAPEDPTIEAVLDEHIQAFRSAHPLGV